VGKTFLIESLMKLLSQQIGTCGLYGELWDTAHWCSKFVRWPL